MYVYNKTLHFQIECIWQNKLQLQQTYEYVSMCTNNSECIIMANTHSMVLEIVMYYKMCRTVELIYLFKVPTYFMHTHILNGTVDNYI